MTTIADSIPAETRAALQKIAAKTDRKVVPLRQKGVEVKQKPPRQKSPLKRYAASIAKASDGSLPATTRAQALWNVLGLSETVPTTFEQEVAIARAFKRIVGEGAAFNGLTKKFFEVFEMRVKE